MRKMLTAGMTLIVLLVGTGLAQNPNEIKQAAKPATEEQVKEETQKSTATFAETTEWLQRICSIHTPKSKVTFDGYNISAEWSVGESSGITMESFAIIPLSAVSNIKITQKIVVSKTERVGRNLVETKTPKWIVTLTTKEKFSSQLSFQGRHSTSPSEAFKLDSFDLGFLDEQIATRVQAAFAHAVELAKAQKEPF